MRGPVNHPPRSAAYQVFLFDTAGELNYYSATMNRERKNADDEEGWEFGDAWKQGSPDERKPEEDVEYVEILRADTGQGYDDSLMIDLVGYLGSRGIRATYDSFSLGAELGAIKTYVLLVEAGNEDEALAYLKEKM